MGKLVGAAYQYSPQAYAGDLDKENWGLYEVAQLKNFKWTNADQNVVAGYIAQDGMSPEAAAEKWVKANQDKVQEWLPQS